MKASEVPRDDHDPSRGAAVLLEYALLSISGTVTEFLEGLTGEALEAGGIERGTVYATDLNDLKVQVGHPLRWRCAVLRGMLSRRAYLYAQTVIVADRLPSEVCRRLETTSQPIGRVFAEEGLATTRTGLGRLGQRPDVGWSGPGGPVHRAFYARRSRIDSAGMPVMLIDEWFLQDARDAVLGRP